MVTTVETWLLPPSHQSLDDMRRRLRGTRWPASPEDSGWGYGVDLDYLRTFAEFLREGFDWAAVAKRDSARRFRIQVTDETNGEDILIHAAVHAEGAAADGRCLILLHGWPSCSFEFDQLIALLRETTGGAVKIVSFDLPGFGFSGRLKRPMAPRTMARLLHRAAVEGLGISRFHLHGNDWGSTVGSWIAFDHASSVAAAHFTMMGMRPALSSTSAPLAPDEAAWVKEVQGQLRADGGYREIQSTKPTTLAVGLTDSPAGLSAWIVEKMHGWTGSGERADPCVGMHDLAAIVTAYWISGNIDTANWIYTAVHAHDDTVAPAIPCPIRVGLSFFGGGFFPPPPATWTKRVYDVRFRRDHSRGGHYPALTEPQLLADDLASFMAGMT